MFLLPGLGRKFFIIRFSTTFHHSQPSCTVCALICSNSFFVIDIERKNIFYLMLLTSSATAQGVIGSGNKSYDGVVEISGSKVVKDRFVDVGEDHFKTGRGRIRDSKLRDSRTGEEILDE